MPSIVQQANIGVNDASVAPAGFVGEAVENVTSVAVGSLFTIAQFGNVASIGLSAGDWIVTGVGDNAFLAACTEVTWAVSQFSGNTTTDHVRGSNVQDSNLGVTGAVHGNVTIAWWTVNVNAATVVYLKCSLAGAVGNVLTGRISARRMR